MIAFGVSPSLLKFKSVWSPDKMNPNCADATPSDRFLLNGLVLEKALNRGVFKKFSEISIESSRFIDSPITDADLGLSTIWIFDIW